MKTATFSTVAFAASFAILTASPVHAYKIGGNVTQTTEVDNVITASTGSNTYARTTINTVYDGANIGGDVRQSLSADNVITAAVGAKATACTSINVTGERDCSRR